MRYERKYKFKRGLGACLANFLICNKFKEIYPKRIISSLYYDDLNYKNYYDSINGLGERSKFRIRFYNKNSDNLQIEIKNKKGELGYKIFPNLKDIFYDDLYYLEFPSEFLKSSKKCFPNKVNNKFYPLIFVNYNRRYFISEFQDMRITIDSSIKFSAASLKNKSIFIDFPRNTEHSVLEVKFSQDQIINENFIYILSNNFDLFLDRSSKYCDAVEMIFNI